MTVRIKTVIGMNIKHMKNRFNIIYSYTMHTLLIAFAICLLYLLYSCIDPFKYKYYSIYNDNSWEITSDQRAYYKLYGNTKVSMSFFSTGYTFEYIIEIANNTIVDTLFYTLNQVFLTGDNSKISPSSVYVNGRKKNLLDTCIIIPQKSKKIKYISSLLLDNSNEVNWVIIEHGYMRINSVDSLLPLGPLTWRSQ